MINIARLKKFGQWVKVGNVFELKENRSKSLEANVAGYEQLT